MGIPFHKYELTSNYFQTNNILLAKNPLFKMNVGLALRNTPKGRIKYDKYWGEEGRTKEVLNNISGYTSNIKISISPQILSRITSEVPVEINKDERDAKAAVSPTSPKVIKHKSSNGITESYFYEVQTEMELPILEYEEERLKYIQDTFNSKRREYDNYSSEIQQHIKQEYLLVKRKNELDAKRRDGELQNLEKAMLTEAREKEMIQREQYQSHVKKLSAKVLEAELRQKKAEEELRKREQEQREFKVQLSNCKNEAENLATKSIEKLTSCEHMNYLRVPPDDRLQQMAKILEPINNLMEVAKSTELIIDDILNANLLVQSAYDTFQDILNDIESAKGKFSQNKERLSRFSFKESFQSPKDTYSSVKDTSSSNSSASKKDVSSKTSEMGKDEIDLESLSEVDIVGKSKEEERKLLSQFIAPDAIENHHRIMENLKRVENLALSLKTDPRNKKYRFQLQKAINTPINSLSSNSGSQIKGKINRLLTILSGKVSEIEGRDMSSNSVVYSFCANLIAKQFVEQGYSQIAAQHSTAFPIALAILGVWNKKPDVGLLILSHFYTRCPYLVPYYPPRQEGQSDKDYFVSLGYELDDEGNPEAKDKFLSKISGFVRLYAAIIISPLPPNIKTPHPHGPQHAWTWLARMLNLDPRPDITATVLFDFLEVTGHSLQKVYGGQFKKILHILCKDYFPRIRQVTPGGSGGPVERLETFLQQTVKRGYISPPAGVLDAGFWNR